MDAVDRFTALVAAQRCDVPLDVGALCIAASFRPVDVDAARERLDDLAAACHAHSFAAVREQLFDVQRFSGNTDDYADPENSFLDVVLERRRGLPITLSVLVIEVSRRLGINVHGIGMPGHFLVQEARCTDLWCDPFNGGALLTRAECARLFALTHGPGRPLRDADLTPTPPRAILARMLANLEHGPLAQDPRRRAVLCALHLSIPGLASDERAQLVHELAQWS
jgi:regulator of sirC expression with transglutaminase-like and TPR domain